MESDRIILDYAIERPARRTRQVVNTLLVAVLLIGSTSLTIQRPSVPSNVVFPPYPIDQIDGPLLPTDDAYGI